MTADVELLPLPEEEWNVRYGYHADTVRDYARANVERHTAELQAEIEALRTDVAAQCTRADAMAGEAIKHEARAERLVEALRALLPFAEHADNCGDHDAYNNAEVPSCGCGLDGIREHADALLRDQEEGK